MNNINKRSKLEVELELELGNKLETVKRDKSHRTTPTLTITKRGRILFNTASTRVITKNNTHKFKYLRILRSSEENIEENILVFVPTDQEDRSTYKIQYSNKGRILTISVISVLRKLGINIEQNSHFDVHASSSSLCYLFIELSPAKIKSS